MKARLVLRYEMTDADGDVWAYIATEKHNPAIKVYNQVHGLTPLILIGRPAEK